MKARSITPIRTAKWGYIVISILMSVIGVFMIAHPGTSAATIGKMIGITLVLFGIIKVIGYFSKDLFRLAFQFDLQLGIITTLLGVVTLVKTDSILNILFVMLGIWIVVDCAFKLQTAMEAKSFGIKSWWINMILSLISGLLGLLVMFYPGSGTRLLMTLLGFLLISEGIRNLCIAVTCVKIVKHQKPDIIDINYYEVEE